MIALQIISKVLNTKDYSIVANNLLTEDYFIGYESEYNFIKNHYEKFGNVPDIATFLSKFPQITLVDVEESDTYLVDTIREEYLYHKSVPIIQKSAELLKNGKVLFGQERAHLTVATATVISKPISDTAILSTPPD